MKKLILPAALVGVTILLFAIANHQKPIPIIGKQAPDFQLELLKGGQLAMNEIKGKPLMLYFFATW